MTDSTRPSLEGLWVQATVARATHDGWAALTDAGVEISVPGRVVSGLRSLRPGQRIRVRLPRPDAPGADAAAPAS